MPTRRSFVLSSLGLGVGSLSSPPAMGESTVRTAKGVLVVLRDGSGASLAELLFDIAVSEWRADLGGDPEFRVTLGSKHEQQTNAEPWSLNAIDRWSRSRFGNQGSDHMGLLYIGGPNGVPLLLAEPVADARLFVYGAGTDNLRPLFSDSHFTYQTQNPLHADGSGDFPLCYLQDGDYRLVVTDRRGNVVGERDNVSVRTSAAETLGDSIGTRADLETDDLLAYSEIAGKVAVSEGDVLSLAEDNLTFQVVASDATSFHVETAGGVRFLAMPDEDGVYPIRAFSGSFDEALTKAIEAGPVRLEQGVTYTSSTGVAVTDLPVRIFGNGATIQRASNAANAPTLELTYSYSAPVAVASVANADIWAGYPVARLSNGSNFADGDTVSILGRTYTLRAVVSGADDVLIGADIGETLDNLGAAVNADAGEGTLFGSGTVAHTEVVANRYGANLEISAKDQIVPVSVWSFATSNGSATWDELNATTNGGQIDVGVGAIADFAVGDVVKVISDDKLPWSDPSDNEYAGESVRVDAVDVAGGLLLTSRPLRLVSVFATNIRLAKATNRPVDIQNVAFKDSPDFDPEINQPHLRITGAVAPKLAGISTDLSAAGLVELLSCFRPESKGISGESLRTSLASNFNVFGYVLVEYGCTDGVHVGMLGRKCRHVYTTGARRLDVVPSASVERYGGTIGSNIQGIGADCEHNAFDTHADALNISFDIDVRQSYRGLTASLFGVQLRGQGHMLRGTVEGQACLAVLVDGTGTGGHDIDLKYVRPDLGQAETTEIVRFNNAGSVQGTCRLRFDATVYDYGAPIITTTGVDLNCLDVSLSYGPNADFNGAVFYPEEAQVLCNNLVWDMMGSTANGPRIVRQKGDNGSVTIAKATVFNAPKFYAGDLGNRATARVVVQELLTDSEINARGQAEDFDLFANRVAGAVGLASVRFFGDLQPNSMAMVYTNAADPSVSFDWEGRLNDRLLFVATNDHTADATVTALSAPAFEGQEMVVRVEGGANGFALGGSTTNLDMPVAQVLSDGDSLRLISYGGTWMPM